MNKIYKCDVCSNIVELVREGRGKLVCYGQPMHLIKAMDKEEGAEKHLPVLKATEQDVEVNISEVDHPMEEKHYIEWIEVATEKGNFRKYLRSGEKPNAKFCAEESDIKSVREYCNVHGMWEKK